MREIAPLLEAHAEAARRHAALARSPSSSPARCFAGTLLELALAADRSYMLDGSGDDAAAHRCASPAMNFGAYPMGNGLTRLPAASSASRGHVDESPRRIGEDLDAPDADEAGLVTVTPDDIDWEDEVRIAIEERASFSPDALTGMEASLRFAGPETLETKIFGRLSAWQNWIFQRPNAVGRRRRAAALRHGQRRRVRPTGGSEMTIVDIERDPEQRRPRRATRRLQRALEQWQPQVPRLVAGDRPDGFQDNDVYLRTAIDVGQEGWAHFGYVKMPDYRWGIFLAEPEADRRSASATHLGQPAWQEVPGEYRAELRRLIVMQGDTEPASVEQQRHLGRTAPSSTTCATSSRSTWRRAVTCGRWSICSTRTSAATGARRPRRCSSATPATPTSPRILGAFNEPTTDWLSFFMFTLLHRPRRQVPARHAARVGFDPLCRTCDFMLTEEAHHMFVGATGVGRVVERTVRAHARARHRRRRAATAASTSTRCSATSTSTAASRSTCSATTCPRTRRTTSRPGSRAASTRASATTTTG